MLSLVVLRWCCHCAIVVGVYAARVLVVPPIPSQQRFKLVYGSCAPGRLAIYTFYTPFALSGLPHKKRQTHLLFLNVVSAQISHAQRQPRRPHAIISAFPNHPRTLSKFHGKVSDVPCLPRARRRRRTGVAQHRIFSSTSTLQSQLHVCFAHSTRLGQLYALAANSMLWPPTLCSGGQLYALTANSML